MLVAPAGWGRLVLGDKLSCVVQVHPCVCARGPTDDTRGTKRGSRVGWGGADGWNMNEIGRQTDATL